MKPPAPQASAYFAKSIGCRSTPNSGLPSKTICSHLIWPSVLFLMTITLTGSLVLHECRDFAKHHRQAAVADDCDHLPARDTRPRPPIA